MKNRITILALATTLSACGMEQAIRDSVSGIRASVAALNISKDSLLTLGEKHGEKILQQIKNNETVEDVKFIADDGSEIEGVRTEEFEFVDREVFRVQSYLDHKAAICKDGQTLYVARASIANRTDQFTTGPCEGDVVDLEELERQTIEVFVKIKNGEVCETLEQCLEHDLVDEFLDAFDDLMGEEEPAITNIRVRFASTARFRSRVHYDFFGPTVTVSHGGFEDFIDFELDPEDGAFTIDTNLTSSWLRQGEIRDGVVYLVIYQYTGGGHWQHYSPWMDAKNVNPNQLYLNRLSSPDSTNYGNIMEDL